VAEDAGGTGRAVKAGRCGGVRLLTGGDDELIPWNFTKFLVDREGRLVRRYDPKVTPDQLADDIEALL